MHRLRMATQNSQGGLCVSYQLTLFMVIAIVLQIPQAAANCGFSRIHAFEELLGVPVLQRQKRIADTKVEILLHSYNI